MKFIERRECPACGSGKAEVKFECRYSDEPVRSYLFGYYKLHDTLSDAEFDAKLGEELYTICHCEKCNLVFQKWEPTAEMLSEVYSQWIDINLSDRKIPAEGHRHYMAETLRLTPLVLRSTGKTFPSDLHALDYGLGLGGFAKALIGGGMTVFGYDFSDKRQEAASNSGVTSLDLEDIRARKFDFINTEQVFEHLTDLSDTFDMLANALNPGGILKISVPHSADLEKGDFRLDWKAPRYARHSVIPIAPLEHLQYFRRPSLALMAKRGALEAIDFSFRDATSALLDVTRPKRLVRQLGWIFARAKLRNYRLFRKPMG